MHDMFDRMMGLVNMTKRALLQAPGVRIIFLLRHVMMGFVQQLESLANAAPAGHMQIDADVVMDVLAVIDGSALDLVNGVVNFVDGMLFFFVDAVIRANFVQVGAGIPQIGERVQVVGMTSWIVRRRYQRHRGQEKEQEGKLAE
jgi:hypothetical protein